LGCDWSPRPISHCGEDQAAITPFRLNFQATQGREAVADFIGVPAAQFADVLDHLIDGAPGPFTAAAATGILTAPLVAAPMSYGYAAWLFREAPLPPVERPIRRLTFEQQEAFETLRRAGAADLRPDYFASELKSAFRRLARQLHPDRHPGAGAEMRARLATAFQQVREAYRALPL